MNHPAARLGRHSAGPLAALAFPSAAQSAPIVITDPLGRIVTLKAPAARIVLCFNG